MDIANNVRKYRKKRGWSQRELARRAGLSQPCVRNVESGDRPNPQVKTLDALARALGVSIDNFLR